MPLLQIGTILCQSWRNSQERFHRKLCLFWAKQPWLKVQKYFRLCHFNERPLRKGGFTNVQILVGCLLRPVWKKWNKPRTVHLWSDLRQSSFFSFSHTHSVSCSFCLPPPSLFYYVYTYIYIHIHIYTDIPVWWAPRQTLSLTHTLSHFLVVSLPLSLFYVYTCIHVFTYIYWQTSWVSMRVCDKLLSFFLTYSVFLPLSVPPPFYLVLCIHTYTCIYIHIHASLLNESRGGQQNLLSHISLPSLCLAQSLCLLSVWLSFSLFLCTNIYTFISIHTYRCGYGLMDIHINMVYIYPYIYRCIYIHIHLYIYRHTCLVSSHVGDNLLSLKHTLSLSSSLCLLPFLYFSV